MKTKLITKTKSGAITKEDAIAIWESLPNFMPLQPEAIPYKHEGTTIDEDGIRICGSFKFITSVLSHMKGLLEQENNCTRLGIAFSEITDRYTGQIIKDRYRCAIQVHERGSYARVVTPKKGDYREKHKDITLKIGFK